MSYLHDGLLGQARFLATAERGKPTQVNLRRSISASYYALFHRLIYEAINLMLQGRLHRLRQTLARTFDHGYMKNAAKAFANSSEPPSILKYAFKASKKDPAEEEFIPIPEELNCVASAFISLQESRYEADYNLAFRATRKQALDLVELTEDTFRDLDELQEENKTQADIFFVALLIFNKIKGRKLEDTIPEDIRKLKRTYRNK